VRVLFYLVFAAMYSVWRLLMPIRQEQVVMINTHDTHMDGNVGEVYRVLREKYDHLKFAWIRRVSVRPLRPARLAEALRFMMVCPYILARARFVFLDNVFLPMAFMRFPGDVRVVQLWHGCGAIKKYGQDVNRGVVRWLEKKANTRYTDLVVNSRSVVSQYLSAFGVSENVLRVTGLPRTDYFFDPDRVERGREKFFERYPELRGKKLLLYSPTFRDHEVKRPRVPLDFLKLSELLGEDWRFLLRFHPYVAKHAADLIQGRVTDVSDYPDLNGLLAASDVLVTDYSSIIFEYSLLNKPMVFYPYDLESFRSQQRGFYVDYERFVPGPIARNEEQLAEAVRKALNQEEVSAFREKHFDYLDGKSTERLIQDIMNR
jgi:CDP-ribitol ribitolphosphotransferase